jgi:hypothetical protein
LPQSSQNADEGAFSAPHFGQRLGSGLPHAAQNFLLVVLSVPHLVQRIALPGNPSDWPFLYHPAPGRGSGLPKGVLSDPSLEEHVRMRETDRQQRGMLSYISAEQRMSNDHPLPDDSALGGWGFSPTRAVLRLHLRQ